MSLALPVDGTVDRVRRLRRDPPVKYDRTAWGVDEIDGEMVLVETAVIDCPDPECDGRAFWADGVAACGSCETRQRLIG
ncbi:hypothetical protein [Halosimplex marinum]|uniref:hypothetical protein n=1 Tax=Halosimplex marinum TaxID=3396620 RepID=UPI003F578AFA